MGAGDALIPRQPQGANAAAKADAHLAQVAPDARGQLEGGTDLGPQVFDTAADDIAVAVVQDVAAGVGGDWWSAAAAEAEE